MWNWGVIGVEVRGLCGTEGFLVWNWGDSVDFGCREGVVLVWNWCVELRGLCGTEGYSRHTVCFYYYMFNKILCWEIRIYIMGLSYKPYVDWRRDKLRWQAIFGKMRVRKYYNEFLIESSFTFLQTQEGFPIKSYRHFLSSEHPRAVQGSIFSISHFFDPALRIAPSKQLHSNSKDPETISK